MNTTQTRDFAAVVDLLADYYDGLYYCDVDKLRAVFSSSARYATASSGELLELGIDDYLTRVAARTPPAEDGTPYGLCEVRAIRFAGPVTALAEVHSTMFGHDYVDFLTLLRLDGRWRVQSKVFHGTPSRPQEN